MHLIPWGGAKLTTADYLTFTLPYLTLPITFSIFPFPFAADLIQPLILLLLLIH